MKRRIEESRSAAFTKDHQQVGSVLSIFDIERRTANASDKRSGEIGGGNGSMFDIALQAKSHRQRGIRQNTALHSVATFDHDEIFDEWLQNLNRFILLSAHI